MTLGERIGNLRRDAGYSQEYVAESLGVSRQAVSKWETDLSSPDTENLIKLAELLNTSVQFLATGKDFYFPEGKPAPETKKIKITKKLVIKIIAIIIGTIIFLAAAAYVLIGLFGTVRFDSAACSGGYRTFLFDKYSEELTEKFLENIENSKERHPVFVSARPVGKEHVEMNSSKRDIWLTFTILGVAKSGNEYAYSVTFKGKRIWYDTYKWTSVSINGDFGNPYFTSISP